MKLPITSPIFVVTANNNVPYVAVFLNTRDGPVILDVPAASDKTVYFGSILFGPQVPRGWESDWVQTGGDFS